MDALYEPRQIVIACEAFFALSHKASFDANKPNQRFAVLNKIITDLFGKEKVMHALLHLPHSSRNLSRRTFVQADTARFARGYAPLVRAKPTTNHVGLALPRTAGMPLNYIRQAAAIP
ncbi:MAG: hypothetical protein ABL911_07080 [Gallionella sp.]|nr:hypothetical protein [Gallionella sp.]